MTNLKQHLIEEIADGIVAKEREINESDEELAALGAKLKIEKKALEMQDLKEDLRGYFKYSIQALENMIVMEQARNSELKKDLEMAKYRKAVIQSQFSDSELG